MMKKYLSLIIISLLALVMGFKSSADSLVITDYHRTFIPGYDKNNQLKIAIRQYYIGNTPYFLTVNPYSLNTQTIPVSEFSSRSKETTSNNEFSSILIQNTPYLKALSRYNSPPYLLQNDGLVAANHAVNGQFLTIDMCPTNKPFEATLFRTLVAEADNNKKATPIAISMSGLWMIGHSKEFNWLLRQQKQKKLQITWINHSFSHVYYPDKPLKENFLLIPGTNFASEILATEKILIAHHQTPSVFFRFPGLISRKDLILQLKDYGLIPIGSNAWLAKDQSIKNGSVILIHGNSNEPQGVALILPLLKNSKLNLLPLNQAIF